MQDEEERATHFPGFGRLQSRFFRFAVENSTILELRQAYPVLVRLRGGRPHRLMGSLVKICIVVVPCFCKTINFHMLHEVTKLHSHRTLFDLMIVIPYLIFVNIFHFHFYISF